MVTDTLIVALAASAGSGQATVLTIALSVLGSSVVAGLIGTILGNTRANAAARRERYGAGRTVPRGMGRVPISHPPPHQRRARHPHRPG